MRGKLIISISGKFYRNMQIKSDKPDRKIRFPMFCLSRNDLSFLSQIYEKESYLPPKFLKNMYLRKAVIQNFFCCSWKKF